MATPLGLAVGAVCFFYLATIAGFCFYLHRNYPALWASFEGRGAFKRRGVFDSYQLVRAGFYAIFQSEHWSLNDRRATIFVFAIRYLLAAIIILAVIRASVEPF